MRVTFVVLTSNNGLDFFVHMPTIIDIIFLYIMRTRNYGPGMVFLVI